MKLGALFTGGKDSTYAAYLAGKEGHEIACLISIYSENLYSFMFHTPSIRQVERQADRMGVPIITAKSAGEKEKELRDLEDAISEAVKKHAIEGLVTGAVASEYQASRVEAICKRLGIASINPLWHMEPLKLLEMLLRDGFRVIITGVAAEPLGREWLGREIDRDFISDMKRLSKSHGISPAGEGGEFETLVLDCPLFSSPLRVVSSSATSSGDNHRLEVELE